MNDAKLIVIKDAGSALARCGRLVVVSSALIAAKDTLSWLTGVQGEFGEKPKYAAPPGALGAAAMTAGIGIFAVGVLKAL